MDALVVLLAIAAIWRITHMLQDEDGPFGVFARLQAYMAKKPEKVGSIQDGFWCFYCLSVWVSFPFALALTDNGKFFIYWFGLSTGAIFLYLLHKKLEQ